MPEEIALIHADESCLGNGQDEPTPGGAASLIEVRSRAGIVRKDVYICSPDTTNNRMALSGAIATFALLGRKGRRFTAAYVSDSEYLVKGMSEWVPGWISRGWRRKGGAIENLELWRALVQVAASHDVRWLWVRGHAGHAKNEYTNDLAIQAAQEQRTSEGAVDSGFPEWLAQRQARGKFDGYDADADFATHESRLKAAG